ncbi:MAG: hypothetical protein R2857_01300 [Vampirovibrionales bacterium]
MHPFYKKLLCLCLLVSGVAFAWLNILQNQPAQAAIRLEKDLFDPRSSEGQGGVKISRVYYEPIIPTYLKYDFEAFKDYGRDAYSPYAKIQIFRTLYIGGLTVDPGYYLVKLDIVDYPTPPADPNTGTSDGQGRQANGNGSRRGFVFTDLPQSQTAQTDYERRSGEEPHPVGTNPKQTSPDERSDAAPGLTRETPPSRSEGLDIGTYQQTVNQRTANHPGENKQSTFLEDHLPKLFKRQPSYPPVSAADPETNRSRLSLLLIDSGNVEVAIPVWYSRQTDIKHKKGRAQMIVEPGSTLEPEIVYLRYCVKRYCYRSATLAPGLIQ